MLEAINTWSDYRAKVREFDAVLEHGKAASAAMTGLSLSAPQASYGEQIFVKLLAHCITLRRLAPDPGQQPPGELWDLASLCAVARCVVEAHDAFEYIAGHSVTDCERRFRLQLWELHGATQRLKVLAGIGSTDAAVAAIRIDAARLQLALGTHAHLGSLSKDEQRALHDRLSHNNPPSFHLSRRQRCELSGVDADWHNAIMMQLSQHVHTLPFSVRQLLQFQAGTPEALRLMALPLVFALPFLVRVIHRMELLAPGRIPRPPSRTARTMAVWQALGERGLKDIE